MIGASEPYDTADQQDHLALLDHLGAQHVYVMGISWSAQLTVSLAEALIPTGKLRGCMPISSQIWDTKNHAFDWFAALSPMMKCFTWLFTKEWLMRPLSY